MLDATKVLVLSLALAGCRAAIPSDDRPALTPTPTHIATAPTGDVGAATLTLTLTSSLMAGQSAQLVAVLVDANGAATDVSAAATWSSSKDAVIQIAGAFAIATAAGTATVEAILDGQSASATITVAPAALLSLSLALAPTSAPLGSLAHGRAIATYSDGTTGDVTAMSSWSSLDAAIANVGATAGDVQALGLGTTTLAADFGGLHATATLTVTPAVLTSILVVAGVPRPYTEAQQLTATGTYSDGTSADVTIIAAWSSSNPSLGTMSPTTPGLLQGVASGVVTITAAVGEVTGSAPATLVPLLVGLVTDNSAAPLHIGDCRQVDALLVYDDGSTQPTGAGAFWSTSDESIATVGTDPDDNGLVCALAVGTATMTVNVGWFTVTTGVDVVE